MGVWAQEQRRWLPFAHAAFAALWAKSDGGLAAGQPPVRTWLWGPNPVAVAMEPYAEGVGGEHLVQYFPKGRMEVPGPNVAHEDDVGTGSLTLELVSGLISTGQSQHVTAAPSQQPVTGDPESPETPTYASFRELAALEEIDDDTFAPDRTGETLTQAIDRDGQVHELQLLPETASPAGEAPFRFAYYNQVTRRNVIAAFVDFLTAPPEIDWLRLIGHPITEPFWTRTRVRGQDQDVVVQLFERRVLTYTPENPAPWRVEMANTGWHYYQWRYEGQAPAPLIVADPATPGHPVTVRGFNWPARSDVRLTILQPNATTADAPVVSGLAAMSQAMAAVTTGAQGSFETDLPWSSAVAGAYARAGTDLVVLAALAEGRSTSSAPLPIGETVTERITGTVAQAILDQGLLEVRLANGVRKLVVIMERTAVRWPDGRSGSLTDAVERILVRGAPDRSGVLLASHITLLGSESGH
jgi:hypothetical protein